MKRILLGMALGLALSMAAPCAARADVSKESPASSPTRKLQREWQVESRLFTADKEAPAARKGAAPASLAPTPKLDK